MRADVALSGDLEHIHLSSLIQLAELDGFTGVLALPEEPRAIEFSKGQMCGAHWGAVAGVRAFRCLFLQERGLFELVVDPTVCGTPIGNSAMLIMEAFQAVDEWNHVRDLVCRIGDDGRDDVPAELSAIVPLLDGAHTVGEAVAATRAEPCSVGRAVRTLIDAGRISVVGTRPSRHDAPAPTPAVDPAPADRRDFYELLDEGRALLRDGAYERAEDSFRRALDLRPNDRIALQNLRRASVLRGHAPLAQHQESRP